MKCTHRQVLLKLVAAQLLTAAAFLLGMMLLDAHLALELTRDLANLAPQPHDVTRRRRVQFALRLCDSLSLVFWATCFIVRRPWGLILFIAAAATSLVALSCFPLPADPKQRTLARMAGHYACAAAAFISFFGALLFGHGWCGWPVLPFVLCTVGCAVLGLAEHVRAIERHACVRAALHAGCAACEWAAVAIFYAGLMLPPSYVADR